MKGTITKFFVPNLWIIGHICLADILDLSHLVFPLRFLGISLITVTSRKHSSGHNSKKYDPIHIKLRRWYSLSTTISIIYTLANFDHEGCQKRKYDMDISLVELSANQ